MFHENLKSLRKARGLSQETLAAQLHVVRQTISKWEKGLSVPDAEMLVKIADLLDTNVSVLLGAAAEVQENPSQLAIQLGRIAEEMAVKNRRTKRLWRVVAITLIIMLVFLIFQFAAAYVFSYDSQTIIESQEILITP